MSKKEVCKQIAIDLSPVVTINGIQLHMGDTKTIQVALETFLNDIQNSGVCKAKPQNADTCIAAMYIKRCKHMLKLLKAKQSRGSRE